MTERKLQINPDPIRVVPAGVREVWTRVRAGGAQARLMAGRIATAQGKSLERLRDARKSLNAAEDAAKRGMFETALVNVEHAETRLRSARRQIETARDGVIEVQRPTG